MSKAEEIDYKAVTAADNQEPPKDYVISAHADHFNGFVEGYKQGYNQAEQDLMDKAKQWFTDNIPSEKLQLWWCDFELFIAEN